jgi:hypothetical protein
VLLFIAASHLLAVKLYLISPSDPWLCYSVMLFLLRFWVTLSLNSATSPIMQFVCLLSLFLGYYLYILSQYHKKCCKPGCGRKNSPIP